MANIFFIDDDFASELIVENLRQRGHNVHRASSVDEALDNIEAISASDLVVLDLIMPRSHDAPVDNPDGQRCTGMAVFKELRIRRAEMPIVVFTANQDPAIIDVVGSDKHAKYIARWASPKFPEFVALIHKMIGIDTQPLAPQVFIVHGHDDKTMLDVKNYLQNTLHLPEPTVLREKPNLGRTLIEKFEDLASAAQLAFIVLTPDDQPAQPDDSDVKKRRARQNVIFELGFFLGKLGRRSGRVFLLHKGPLELPSDLSGIVYIDISSGIQSAAEQIRREIEAVNYIH